MTDWTFAGTWPYEAKFFATDAGQMHYVDEGPRGAPTVVLLHGNPTWSYLYRAPIRALLEAGRRVIAVDHVGFGRSEIPDDPEAYTVEAHRQRLTRLLDELSLAEVVVVVHDWAGPIALPWVFERAERVAGLVVLNTFAPRLPGPMGSRGSIRLLRSRVLGPLLVKRRDVPTEQFLFKAGTANPERWDDITKAAYRAPHPTPQSRTPLLVFPRQIPFTEHHPVATLTQRTADRLPSALGDKPVRIVWGMKDVLFGPEVLGSWKELFPSAEASTLERAGHFLQEDEPQRVSQEIVSFSQLATTSD